MADGRYPGYLYEERLRIGSLPVTVVLLAEYDGVSFCVKPFFSLYDFPFSSNFIELVKRE